jgi:hypothetical protein
MEIRITHYDEAHEEIVETSAISVDWYAQSIMAHISEGDEASILIEDIISIEGDEQIIGDGDDPARYAVPATSGSIGWYDWATVVNAMDDEIREELHNHGCSDAIYAGLHADPARFLAAYQVAHALKFGAIFIID